MIAQSILYYIRKLIFFTHAFLFCGSLFFCLGQGQSRTANPFSPSWIYKTDSVANIQPATDGENIYVPLKSGNIVSLRSIDGAILWKGENGGRISGAPIADINTVYIATEIVNTQSLYSLGQSAGVLRALSRSNGVTLWEKALPTTLSNLISNETMLFGSTTSGELYAFAKRTGEITWIISPSIPLGSFPILNSGNLYISDGQGNLLSLDQTNGKIIKRYQTDSSIKRSLAVFDRTIFAGSTDGYVYALDDATGRLKWRVHTNGSIQSLQVAGKCLLATSLDNYVYCLSPQRGIKLWKRRLAGRVLDQPLVIKNNVVLSLITGEECIILRLQDGKVINSFFLGEDNNTEAAPISSGDHILLMTNKGLFAISIPQDNAKMRE